MEMTKEALQIYHSVREGLAKTYGVRPEAFSEGVPVNPEIQQRLETKIMTSNRFLKQINRRMVRDRVGEKVGITNSKSIAKRTNSNAGHDRKGVNPMSKDNIMYQCEASEYDAVISWDDLDTWSSDPKYYKRWQQLVTHQTGEDRLKTAWWGQFSATETENAGYTAEADKQYDMLQDFHQGWLAYIIEHAPEKVWGLNPDGSVNPIKVGPGGDFTNMDELVADLRGSLIHRKHRSRQDHRVLCGDKLVRQEYLRIYHSNEDEAIQKEAIERYISTLTFGRTRIAESDHFPEHGVLLTPLKNLSHYVQRGSFRRSIEANKHRKGVEDFSFMREEFLLEDLDMVAMIHPDAIQFKDRSGDWVSVADDEKWSITVPADTDMSTTTVDAMGNGV